MLNFPFKECNHKGVATALALSRSAIATLERPMFWKYLSTKWKISFNGPPHDCSLKSASAPGHSCRILNGDLILTASTGHTLNLTVSQGYACTTLKALCPQNMNSLQELAMASTTKLLLNMHTFITIITPMLYRYQLDTRLVQRVWIT